MSTWPIYLTINELPRTERKQKHNTLLLGIQFGDHKPYFNQFIYSFRPVFEKLLNGIRMQLPNAEDNVVRAILLMGVCDLPAKSECLNFTQFNGRYGCPVCFFPGEVRQIGPHSHTTTYNYTRTLQTLS